MQRLKTPKRGKRLIQLVLLLIVLVAVVFFVGKYWNQQWHALMTHHFQVNPWLLALAFLGFLLQEISYGLIWRKVLARLGADLGLRPALRIYLASEFVRYIPGNVWHVLTRVLWSGKYGISRPTAFTSMVIELITKLAAGGLVFACSLLFWSDVGAVATLVQGQLVFVLLGIVCIVGLLVVLHPRVLNTVLTFGLRKMKREPIVLSLRYQDILLVTLYWCVSWIVAGGAFFLLLWAIWPGTSLVLLPICIGIYALAWDIGFLSFITPSGLGFREVAITFLFSLAFPSLPVEQGAILAILSRLVSTGAELLCVTLAYVSGGKQVRALQQEEMEHAEVQEEGLQEGQGEDAASLVPPRHP